MPYAWPEDSDLALWELDIRDHGCATCGRMMHVCDHLNGSHAMRPVLALELSDRDGQLVPILQFQ
jgi:hypothetical protein